MPLHSATFIALSCLLLTALSALTSRLRARYHVYVGYGDHPDLQRMSRAHGVSLEHLLPLLLLLLVLELCGASHWIVDVFGAAIVGTRLVHVIGAVATNSRLRVWAMTATYAVEVALAMTVLSRAARRF